MSLSETTLIIIKPKSISKGLVGAVLTRLELGGFQVIELRTKQLIPLDLERLYPHAIGKEYWPGMVELYTSELSVVGLIHGEKAIEKVRALVGSTLNPAPRTIRHTFGNKAVPHDNVVHASDSQEAFHRECLLFF